VRDSAVHVATATAVAAPTRRRMPGRVTGHPFGCLTICLYRFYRVRRTSR
jgi:hypothetical protein